MEARFKVTGRWKLTNKVTSLKKKVHSFLREHFYKNKSFNSGKKIKIKLGTKTGLLSHRT